MNADIRSSVIAAAMDSRTKPELLDPKPTKVLVVDDWHDTIRKISHDLAVLRAKSGLTMAEQIDAARLENALRGAKKLGINPQGPSLRPRPSFAAGEQLDVLGKSYWVARVKADGRLRLTWSGSHHGVGAVIPIKGVRYLVTGAGPRQILLRESTAEECARMDGPWESPEIKVGFYVSPRIEKLKKRLLAKSAHERNQLARRVRKENRLSGIAERKAERAAAAAA